MNRASLWLRAALKLRWWLRRAELRAPSAVEAARGFDGIVALLQDVDGDDAAGLLRACGARVGGGTRISRGLVIHNAGRSFSNLQLGDRCHVGRQVLIDLAAPVRIGERVTISMRTMVITHTDPGDSRCGLERTAAGVTIGDDAYIGAGALLLPGVSIGARAVIGAGAVVTRDVAAGAVASGVPARSTTAGVRERVE